MSLGKAVHNAAVQVWFFLESTGNVNTVGGQPTLAYEIRGAHMLRVIFTGAETCCEFRALEQKVAML